MDYGNTLDDSPDVSQEKLDKICQTFLQRHVVKTLTVISNIQSKTTNQSYSDTWIKEKHIRLTSSSFGKVISRRPCNTSTALLKNILYSKFHGNIRTIRGLAQEQNTVIEYKT